MTRNLEIATTIKNQLYSMDKMQMWGLGAKKFVAIEKGLRFTVNGAKLKGDIEITLDEGKDLYIVEFIKIGRVMNKELKEMGIKSFNQVRKVLKRCEEVYTEDLCDLLDQYAY